MKKDIKSLIMKSLIVAVFLIIGNAVWAQHPLLSDDELNVYVLPNQQQITIGKQAYDEGRTCYKWNGYFSEEGVEERIGALQVFSRPSYMTLNTSFEYHLTVIGEQYYEQTVWVHVGYFVTFEVTPKKPCFFGYGVPQLWDYNIVTTPPGYESYVSIQSMHPQTPNVINGHYDVDFVLTIDNNVLDQHTVEIIKTDDPALIHEFNVPVDRILKWGETMEEVVEMVDKGLKCTPGWYGSINVEMPEMDFGNWTITHGYDCCDEIKNQLRVDIDHVGVSAKLNLDGGFNFVLGKAFLRGQIESGLGLNNIHTSVFKTCNVDPPTINFNLNSTVSVGAYVEDFSGGKLLSAYARFALELTRSFVKLDFIGNDYALANGSFTNKVYFESKITLISLLEKSCTVIIVPEKTLYINTPIYLR